MAEKERKFVPSIVVPSDDLVVTDDEGNEHRPHAGEWVKFRKGMPLAIMRAMTQAAELANIGENMTPDRAGEAQALLAGLVDAIAQQVVDWSWTDLDWQPYPRPADAQAFREVLWKLDDYEMKWLQSHLADGAKVAKN